MKNTRVITNKKHKGFTLIELMLATSLLMLVMFSGYYAYSLYSEKWQKRVGVFWSGTKQAMALDVVNKLLIATSSYVAKGEDNKEHIYFSGSASTIRFISQAPLYSSGSAVVELSVESTNETYQLIYKERELKNNVLYSTELINAEEYWQRKILLLTGKGQLQWAYFGWETFTDAVSASQIDDNYNKEDSRKWYSNHKIEQMRILPNKVQLQMNYGENKTNILIDLPPNSLYKLISAMRVDA